VIPESLVSNAELTSSLYLRVVHPVRGPGNPDEGRIEAQYSKLLLISDAAHQQLMLVDQALTQRGLCAIAMKGASHTLTLYTGALPRHLSDLDLVVPAAHYEQARTALAELGFEPEPWNGPEDAFLQAQEGPGLRFLAPDRLPVDLQTRFPGLPPDGPAFEEAWAAARPLRSSDGHDTTCWTHQTDATPVGGLWLLNPMHELLLAAAHLQVHLKPPLTVSPKWITDMLLMIHRNATGRHPRIGPPIEGNTFEEKLAKITLEDLIWPFAEPVCGTPEPGRQPEWTWDSFWQTAARWGIAPQCQIACATLNAYWQAGIPLVPADAAPIPLERLFATDADHALASEAAIPSAYLERLARLRALPDTTARIRYLVNLAFPTAEGLRYRYALPPAASVLPYRILHPIRTTWKLLRGISAALALRIKSQLR
jgi:hypothetical protein